MLSRNQAKHIQSLKLARFRKLNGQFIAEGVKMADELIASPLQVAEIFALRSWIGRNQEKIARKGLTVLEVNETELARISQLSTPNEVLLVVTIPRWEEEPDTDLKDMILYLDRIQDPGNMGTILRTADWFGIRSIVCSQGCADIYNPKVVQATMGSITRIRVVEKDPESFFPDLKGRATTYGSFLEGEDIYQADLKLPAVIVIGNESQGISPDLMPYIHRRVSIPGWEGQAESLNASVATGIVCAEFRRRMR